MPLNLPGLFLSTKGLKRKKKIRQFGVHRLYVKSLPLSSSQTRAAKRLKTLGGVQHGFLIPELSRGGKRHHENNWLENEAGQNEYINKVEMFNREGTANLRLG